MDDEELVGSLQSLTINKINKIISLAVQATDPSWRPECWKRAYLHPSTMRSLGVEAGDPVLVSNVIFKAWPRPAVGPKGISFSSDTFAVNATVTVERVPLWEVEDVQSLQVKGISHLGRLEMAILQYSLRLVGYVQVGDQFDLYRRFGSLQITAINDRPSGFGKFSGNASVTVERQVQTFSTHPVGGLEREIGQICKAIKFALGHAAGPIKAPRGFLLSGPPGTGKTLMVGEVARRLGLPLTAIDASLVLGQYFGESEAKLREIFAIAIRTAPVLLFFDEIDALCPKRSESGSSSENRLVATFLTLLDQIEGTSVFVVAATNAPASIDPALRRPGRLDLEIEVPIPSAEGRREILEGYLSKGPISLEAIQQVAQSAHGFVGADLVLLCKEAALLALKRSSDTIGDGDLLDALQRIRPSGLCENVLQIPRLGWSEIGGQAETRRLLRESIEIPLKVHEDKFLISILQNPHLYHRMGIRPPKGILLYGPPGCSKTLIAKAMANESKVNFLAVKGPQLLDKWVGQSERAIAEVFRKARASAPSILFFDEFDAIGSHRSSDEGGGGSSVGDRVISQLLYELDGVDPLVGVTIVAATNRPDIIDPALLRPGRLDRHIYVALPTLTGRREIFEIEAKRMAFDPLLDLDQLACRTEGLSGAEIHSVCQEAGMAALVESVEIPFISQRHFDQSLARKPQTDPVSLRAYEAFKDSLYQSAPF